MITFDRTHHIELWEWSAKALEKARAQKEIRYASKLYWPRWKEFEASTTAACFCCYPAALLANKLGKRYRCSACCPLSWIGPKGGKKRSCLENEALYKRYHSLLYTVKVSDEARKEAAYYARLIAHLPLSQEWKRQLELPTPIVRVI